MGGNSLLLDALAENIPGGELPKIAEPKGWVIKRGAAAP